LIAPRRTAYVIAAQQHDCQAVAAAMARRHLTPGVSLRIHGEFVRARLHDHEVARTALRIVCRSSENTALVIGVVERDWGLDHSSDPADFMAKQQLPPGTPWNYIPSDSISLLNQVYSVPH